MLTLVVLLLVGVVDIVLCVAVLRSRESARVAVDRWPEADAETPNAGLSE